MRLSMFLAYLLCGFIPMGSSVFFTSSSAINQADKTEGNKQIIVLFKGSTKDPEAKVSMDGREKGKLTGGTYLAMPANEGSHTITVGENSTRSAPCDRNLGAWNPGRGGGGPKDYVDMPFHPASLTVVLSERPTTYLLIERKKVNEFYCSELDRNLNNLTDHKLHEIKAEEGEKLTKKYQMMQ